jgi:RHS repeat-associated protein
MGGVYSGGSYSSVNFWHGLLDEVRLSNIERSDDWVTTEYNNQSSPSTFYTLSSASGSGSSAVQWLVTDQLGTPRMIFDQTGALANVKRHDYLPFGEELFAGTGGRTTAQGYSGDSVRQKFTLKERDNETGLDYFGARYYSSTQGRFTSIDPLMASGSTGSPQSWNRYSYAYNNPLRFTDPSGMLAGDFYNEDGKRLGTDGLNDGRVYVVTDQAQAKQIQQNKGTTQVSAVSSAVELPSANVRGEMGAAVERSNSPTQDDKKGGFHEEGGTFGTTASGQEKVVNAVPGAYSDPRVPGGSATIDTSNPANPSEAGILTSVSGTFHVHPKGEITTTTGPAARPGVTVIGGTVTTTTANFNQPPSAVDIQNAQTRGISNNIVLGARSKTVYVYGGAGVRATFPLKQFLNIGRK